MSARVLIVDDSLTVQMDLRDAFREGGFEASVAGSAAEARRLLGAERIDLIVLDVVLPDTDGIALMSEVKSSPATAAIPIMLLSSEREVRDRIAGLARGAEEYVGKPYKKEYVLRRARELLGDKAPRPPRSTVLVIDDSLTFCEALREELEGKGFRVIACASGEEGLRRAGDLRPDAIVVDGVLPGMNGATVVRRLRLDPGIQGAVCLYLTASEAKADEIAALDAGADGFVQKRKGTKSIVARLGALLRAAEKSRRPYKGATGGTRRLVLVNVSKSVDEWLAPILEAEGHELIRAATHDEALSLLSLQAPDCILVEEANVPAASALCRRLRQLPLLRGVPVVALSLHDSIDGIGDLVDAGADDCIAAEVTSPELLRARIRALLRRHDSEVQERATQDELTRRARKLGVANEELRLYRDLIERMPLGAMVLDWADQNDPFSFRVELVNPAMRGLTASFAPELVGRTIGEALPELSTTKLLRRLALAVRTRATQRLEGFEWGNGGDRIWNVQVVPLVGSKVGILAEDVTALAKAHAERDKLEERMQVSQRLEAIGRLAGGVAHDFNNILTVIDAYTNLSREQLSDDHPAHADLQTILEASQRAAALTAQLLAFGRKQVQQLQAIDLNQTLDSIDRILQRLIGEDINLVTVLATDLGTVRADPTQIEQIVMNLAINARDAMPRGGKLTISTRNVELGESYGDRRGDAIPTGPYVMLAVSDTGTGMDEETQARIFEPFFTSKEQGKGTGLGLATVHGIVHQSGGHIWVYSELGRGTTFKVYLPRVDERPQENVHIEREVVSLLGTETILLVEDEDLVRRAALRMLEGQGYRVIAACGGDEALRFAGEYEGDLHLLLTDIVMPGMSGSELTAQLLEHRPTLKAIYMSGYSDEAIVHHGVLAPGSSFLQKPFSSDSLLRTVRRVLDDGENVQLRQ